MKGFILVFAIFLAPVLNAQPLVRNHLYPFNRNIVNPAATGLTGCLEIAVTDMHQWVEFKEAPNLQSFSIQKGNLFSGNRKHGLGMNLIRDVNGPSKSLEGELLYSFHVPVGRNHTTWLGFGLSGYVEQRRLDESGFSPVFDPAVTGGMITETAFNASSGIYLYNNRLFGGIAIYNLLPVSTYLGQGYGGDRYNLSFQGGYLFTEPDLPAALQTSFQGSVGRSEYQIDLNSRLIFKNNLWLGLTFRKYLGEFETAGQNVLVFVGYEWKNWNFGYNYNFDLNGTLFHHYGTHQLSLGYRICPDNFNCPAYR